MSEWQPVVVISILSKLISSVKAILIVSFIEQKIKTTTTPTLQMIHDTFTHFGAPKNQNKQRMRSPLAQNLNLNDDQMLFDDQERANESLNGLGLADSSENAMPLRELK